MVKKTKTNIFHDCSLHVLCSQPKSSMVATTSSDKGSDKVTECMLDYNHCQVTIGDFCRSHSHFFMQKLSSEQLALTQ